MKFTHEIPSSKLAVAQHLQHAMMAANTADTATFGDEGNYATDVYAIVEKVQLRVLRDALSSGKLARSVQAHVADTGDDIESAVAKIVGTELGLTVAK